MTNRRIIRSTLLGGFCGDALGTTLEFTHPGVKPLPELLTGPHREITGEGPFGVAKGQVTDDSQMGIALALSLMAHNGDLNLDDLSKRYEFWKDHAFDIGGTCGGAIRNIKAYGPEFSGFKKWEESGFNGKANGSLMRTWVVPAILAKFGKTLDDVIRVTILDSAVTHFDPVCMLSCAAYNAAIFACIQSETPLTSAELLAAAQEGLEKGVNFVTTQFHVEDEGKALIMPEELRVAAESVQSDFFAVTMPNPFDGASFGISGKGSDGMVRVAFRLAFWEVVNRASYREALVDTVNRGGDADTNGAIVGGLAGAFFGLGLPVGVPIEWADTVIDCVARRGEVWNTHFHPKLVLQEE